MNSLLIIDDEPGVRSLISRWARNTFSVAEASCAGEALDRMAAHPAAVVLCDVNMPDRDGLWLAAQMHRQFPETAIVLVTGSDAHFRDSAGETGAMDCLLKPFTRGELMDTIDRALDWHYERATAGVWGRAGRPRAS